MSIALDIPPVLVVTARWTDVGVRKEPLRPYGESTHKDTLVALDKMLGANAPTDVSEQVRRRLASGAARDLEDLRTHLKAQADARSAEAVAKLRDRGQQEAADMRVILETQRTRIEQTAAKREADLRQFDLFAKDELKQLEADKRYWHRRLGEVGKELETEPARIRQSYEVKATRFEPVGLVYLWPVTG